MRRGWSSTVAAIACVAYAMRQGQDVNWDQLNYHIYSVFALLHDRSKLDIIPGQVQTWFNPFGEILQYFLIAYFPPRLVAAVLAALASVSVSLVYFIAKESLQAEKTSAASFRVAICGLAAVGALFAPLFISEVGTTFSDYFSSMFFFLALFFIFRDRFSIRSYAFAGVVLGLALDFKLTNAPYVIGWVAAMVVVERRQFLRPLLASGLAAFATYLPIGGAWNLYLYSILKNPAFPLYNNIFKSPAYLPIAMLDDRFRATSFSSALAYFPKWALGEHPTAEIYFIDIRFLIALILFVLALPRVILLLMKRNESDIAAPFCSKRSAFILVFFVVSLAVWLWLYGIQRYAIPLEQLAVLNIFILLSLLGASRERFIQAAIMCVVAVVLVTGVPVSNWGRVSFKGSWFDTKVPNELTKGGILYVMLSGEAFSYVIPALPASDEFIRIEGNMPLSPQTGLGQEALMKISAHQGEIRSLALTGYSLQRSLLQLENFGLNPGDGACLEISTKPRELESCPLERIMPLEPQK